MDLTNSELLDCSPFTGDYSNVVSRTGNTTNTTTIQRQAPRQTPVSGKPRPVAPSLNVNQTVVSKPQPRPVVGKNPPPATNPIGNLPPVTTQPYGTPIVDVPIATIPPVQVVPSMPPMPTGGGGMSSGTSRAQEGSGESTQDGAGEAAKSGASSESKEFYKSYWFWGLLIGGIGGYLIAKNKGKNLMAYGLVGAGIGGGAGYAIEKKFGKMKVTAPATTTTQTTATTPAQ